MSVKIIIGADIVPTKSNQIYFEQKRIQEIISKDLLSILDMADYRIMNLETPLTNKSTPIDKCGPNLIASEESIKGIKQIGIDLLTLSNNHIMDQDEQGFESTIKLLKENSINYVGAGKTLKEASKPYIFSLDQIKIGVYACAEHEFSIVEDNRCGANPFDPLESLDHIQKLKNECDYVIVLYHGGKEHYRYPSPYLQKVCRKIVENGADVVLCQHSHCIGCKEDYLHGTIVYGQGNFLFDYSRSEFWKTALLIQLEIEKNSINIEYIPIVKNGNGVSLADKEQEEDILKSFYMRNHEINQIGFVKNQYIAFSQRYLNVYLRSGVPLSLTPFMRGLNKIVNFKLFEICISKKNKLGIFNFLINETHRELYLEGLKYCFSKKEDK